MQKHTPGMFLTDFRTQKYTGGIISQVGIFLTVTPSCETIKTSNLCSPFEPSYEEKQDVSFSRTAVYYIA